MPKMAVIPDGRFRDQSLLLFEVLDHAAQVTSVSQLQDNVELHRNPKVVRGEYLATSRLEAREVIRVALGMKQYP